MLAEIPLELNHSGNNGGGVKYGEAFLYPPTLSVDPGIRDLPPSSSHLLHLSFPHFCPYTTKTTLQFCIDPSNGCRDIIEAASVVCCRLEMHTRALRIEPEFSTAPLIVFSENPQKHPSPVSFPLLFALPASRPNFILPFY